MKPIPFTDIHKTKDSGPKISTVKNSSIIILNHRNKNNLIKCLNSVMNAIDFSQNTHEVIVLENSASDTVIEDITEFYPRIRIIIPRRKLNLLQLCNLGITESKFDTVITINSNIMMRKDFLTVSLPYFENRNLFALSPASFSIPSNTDPGSTDDNFFPLYCGKIDGFMGNREIDIKIIEGVNHTAPAFFSLAGMSVFDKNKFLQLDGYNSFYSRGASDFTFFADADLAYGAWKSGWGTIFVPQAILYRYEEYVQNGFYNPLPHFISAPVESSKSALYSYLFNLKMKIKWKTNSLLFFFQNITNNELILMNKTALRRSIVDDILKVNFWDLFCMAKAYLMNKLYRKYHRRIADIKYNDEKILTIVSRNELS